MRRIAPIAAALLLRAGTAVCGSALVPGTASQFDLPVGGVERHPIVLDAGAFVHVELRELGPRAVLALLDPAGAIVARREASGEQVTSYRLLTVAPTGGQYALEVRAFGQDGPGRHELRLEAPRAATDMDRRLAAADAALAEAARLASEGTPESRRQALTRLAAAETAFGDADDRRGVAFAVRDRGIVQFALGDPAAAASFEQALGLFRALGDRAGEAVAIGGVAQVRNREGAKVSARAVHAGRGTGGGRRGTSCDGQQPHQRRPGPLPSMPKARTMRPSNSLARP